MLWTSSCADKLPPSIRSTSVVHWDRPLGMPGDEWPLRVESVSSPMRKAAVPLCGAMTVGNPPHC
ncbi:hypothetical protein OI25_6111 [Paraburkholderia fungorum]|uniref:Uncharacterized protein n=1 Tax=Paraburkholderia fungorum TaxID=134537 RepID=A0AAU8T821_9BURK|nr:hypothetical protein OI25_6111 [Paraburkholderia fungorum]